MKRGIWFAFVTICAQIVLLGPVRAHSTVSNVPGSDGLMGAGFVFQFVLGLVVVVGLIFALAWMLRKMNYVQRGVQGNMRILGGLHLGSRERLILVQVGEEQLLLGVASGRVNLVHVLKAPLELNLDDPKGKKSFSALLREVRNRGLK